jgi:DNA invertase Pin-like site-specific DNA recombinase
MRTAAYARYSSDSQREASLEDQLRNIRALCERHGWPEPVVYTDAAISGARSDRPGYRKLLADAHRFDVILVDDQSRLSRDSIEVAKTIKRLTFAGVRLIGVSDGVDTQRKGHKVETGLRGLMSELYLDDLAEKTHRGLTGRALAGSSAGGLPYGYRITAVGQRAIDEAQAVVVRRIFAEYLAGSTARAIAAGLNRDGIPSARGGTWAMTAIHGDARRGIGILVNPIYVGRPIWNRSHWIKHPETGRRVRQERPASEWVHQHHPELAIVTDEVWEAAQARISRKSVPTRGKAGAGRPMRHLLSGILRCEDCGGPLVVVDAYNYGCSTAKDRGTCSSKLRLSRADTEHAMLAGIRQDFLSEDAFQRYVRALTAAVKRAAPDAEAAKRRLADAQREVENIMAAIRAGIITPSTKQALEQAEAAVRGAQRELDGMRGAQPAAIVPRARERWQRMVDALGEKSRNLPAARAAVVDLLGERVVVRNENGNPVAEVAASHHSQIGVVAGAGSVLYLREPVRIPLRRA